MIDRQHELINMVLYPCPLRGQIRNLIIFNVQDFQNIAITELSYRIPENTTQTLAKSVPITNRRIDTI